MTDWNTVIQEAERLAEQLVRFDVDLAEAAKLGDYFIAKAYDREAVRRYLQALSQNPPPRSRRSQGHFRNLKQIWEGWRSNLPSPDQARAWGWAVRQARVKKQMP